MALLEDKLFIKRSSLPGTGKGLFTKETIARGTLIVEYKGEIKTWKEVWHQWKNPYIYYVNKNHVIDAFKNRESFARYANDANGLHKMPGVINNTIFTNYNNKIYLKATRKIEAEAEIFVSYGKEYWKVIKNNMA